MGWANCGTDSQGRSIGYAHEATCDESGCATKIDRGLSYACGGMHGDCGGQACEKYFCQSHLLSVDREAMGFTELDSGQICRACYNKARDMVFEDIAAGDLMAIDADEITRLRSQVEAMREHLSDNQWSARNMDDVPICRTCRRVVHTSDCALAAAIGER